MDKIQATGEALRKLAIDVDYNATSTIAGTALSILKRGNISADNIYDLLQALAKIGRPLNASEKLGMVSPYLNPVTSSAAVVRGLARSYQNGSLDLLDEPPKPTLVNWFFRLTHPSNTGGGRIGLSVLKLHSPKFNSTTTTPRKTRRILQRVLFSGQLNR
jgi:hypothetical protein